MNSHLDPTGLRARRAWWPSAASCAFVAAGLEILSFGLSQYLVQRPTAPPGLTYMGFMIAVAVIGIAVQARALWGVGRRQRAVAPVIARLGQWAVATYVVVSGLLFILPLMPVWAYAFILRPAGAMGSVFHVALIPLTLAFGCLGWASRGDSGPLQRWASRGLLVVTMFGVFSVIRTLFGLFGLPTGQRWLWLASLAVALRAATWAAVGAWLRNFAIRSGKCHQVGDTTR